ncbi:MAG: hypothetical protein V1875_02340 [Candidatus Altiarchaeota archaeon]
MVSRQARRRGNGENPPSPEVRDLPTMRFKGEDSKSSRGSGKQDMLPGMTPAEIFAVGTSVLGAKRRLYGSIRQVDGRLRGLSSANAEEAHAARQFLAETMSRITGRSVEADAFQSAVWHDGTVSFKGAGASRGFARMSKNGASEEYDAVSEKLGFQGTGGVCFRGAGRSVGEEGGVTFVRSIRRKDVISHEAEHRADLLVRERYLANRAITELKSFSRNVQAGTWSWEQVKRSFFDYYMKKNWGTHRLSAEELRDARKQIVRAVDNAEKLVEKVADEHLKKGYSPEDSRKRGYQRLRNILEGSLMLGQFNEVAEDVLSGRIGSREAVNSNLRKSQRMLSETRPAPWMPSRETGTKAVPPSVNLGRRVGLLERVVDAPFPAGGGRIAGRVRLIGPAEDVVDDLLQERFRLSSDRFRRVVESQSAERSMGAVKEDRVRPAKEDLVADGRSEDDEREASDPEAKPKRHKGSDQ